MKVTWIKFYRPIRIGAAMVTYLLEDTKISIRYVNEMGAVVLTGGELKKPKVVFTTNIEEMGIDEDQLKEINKFTQRK